MGKTASIGHSQPTRYDSRAFAADDVPAAARLLAARHARQRRTMPALDRRFERPDECAPLIAGLLASEGASGAAVSKSGRMVGFVLGTRRDDEVWGPNVWVEDAGSAGEEGEAIRVAYALAARRWADEGRTSHYVVVPAGERQIVDAWFRLSFGMQHVHALREPPAADFEPSTGAGLTIRPKERRDLAALGELGLVLPRHLSESPVFSRLPVPTAEESLAEAEEEFDDARLAEFVAEHDGRIVGTAVGCSLELSSGNTTMMRPVSAGLLAHVAVLPGARGLGAGRALAERVLAWSRDEGYEWIVTDWRSTNLEADRSWRGLGFIPSFLRLHRAIG